MHDIFDRSLKFGDLVIENSKAVLSHASYGVVVDNDHLIMYGGKIKHVCGCYLVENLCEEEMKIKESISISYRKYIQERDKASKEKKVRSKERAVSRKEISYSAGDVLYRDTIGECALYLGYCNLVDSGVENEGYLYFFTTKADKLLAYKKENPEYTLNTCTDFRDMIRMTKSYGEPLLKYSCFRMLKNKSNNWDKAVMCLNGLKINFVGAYEYGRCPLEIHYIRD